MHQIIHIVVLLLLSIADDSGAADFEVEQVKSPFVEKKDVGQMMASEHQGLSQHTMQATSPLQDYPYSTPQRKSRRCLSCKQSYGSSSSYSTGGMTGGGASLGSTSSFSFGTDSNYNQPLQSSSRHEFRKEQEFVNGQQVYDFHHERRYKDGQLIDEKRHEKGPDDYDGQHLPSASSGYTSLSSSSGMLQTLGQAGAPSNIYYENNYQGGAQGGVGYDSKFDEFTQKFHSEVERMREELERKTLSLPTHQLLSPPSYGSSHRTEYSSQTKYVNGKPVYLLNEERKYKDGKLIHNVTEAKGPDDFGTSTIHGSQSQSSLPYGRYPNRQINYGGSHSSYESPSEFSSNTGTSYGPSNSGSSERQAISSSSESYSPSNPAYTSDTYQSVSHTSTGYRPNNRPYETDRGTELSNSERLYPSSPSYPYSNKLYTTEGIHSQSTGHNSQERPNNRDKIEHPENNGSNYNYGTSEPTSSSYLSSNPKYTSIGQRAHYQSSTNYSPNLDERPQVVNTDHSDSGHHIYNTYPSESSPSYSRTQQAHINSLHHSDRQKSTNYQLNTQEPARVADNDDSKHPEYGRQSHYNSRNPTVITPRPSRYGYGTGRESYATLEQNLEKTEQRRNTGNVYRPRIGPTLQTGEKIKEASHTSYFESRRNRTHPGRHDAPASNRGVHVVDQNKAPRVRKYRPAIQRTSHEVRKETERRYQMPRYEHRVNETSRIYEPRTHAIATSTWEEESRRSSSPGYQSPDISYRPGRYGMSKDLSDDKDDDMHHNRPKHALPPASHSGTRNYGRTPGRNEDTRKFEEQEERSDISPYDDVSDLDIAENEIDTNRPGQKEYHTHPASTDSSYDRARSHVYEESQSETREQSIDYGYQPVKVTQQDRATETPSRAYSVQNSSRTDHRVTTVIPSRWVETRTTWEYINGRVESETHHYRFYENGILVHENATHKTREEMENDGQDVESLDLSPSQLAEYGQSLPSTTHSQKHEVYQVQRFRNGHKTYEMNHERQFQDGILMLENKEEKDEDDFEEERKLRNSYGTPGNNPVKNHFMNQHISARSQVGADGLYHTRVGTPRSYTNKHEVRKEEEYVNGQKVYDFHHEREYQDGKLVRENRTELGPDDLGTSEGLGIQKHASRNLIRGRTHGAIDESSVQEQRTGAKGVFKTTCLTCGGSHLRSIQQSGTLMGTHGYNSDSLLSREDNMHMVGASQSGLGTHPTLQHNVGSLFRHDVEVEEHYENGQLIKGREESKKWRDGALVDADQEHYYDGPSRVGKISNLVSEMGSTAALSSSPTRTVTRRNRDECASNPCHNRGRCRSNGLRPVCTCPFGFKGEFCDEAYCPKRFCRYGGSCSISGSKHMCQCLEGYSGYRCSTKVNSTHG